MTFKEKKANLEGRETKWMVPPADLGMRLAEVRWV